MTTDTRPARVQWRAPSEDLCHAIVNGSIAGTLRRAYLNQWTLDESTLARYPVLYGIGPRALSTWRAKLAATIRAVEPVSAPATTG